jgi:glycerol-3-phosphate dehydrogenase
MGRHAGRGPALRRDLGALAGREHDVLVVGGGIYGAAAAWDAAQRGLRVALAEKADFASGTSWNSLKTIHGGLRHLQRAELRLMRESVRERRALLRIAPRLVRPLQVVVPAYGHGLRGREALAIGVTLGDLVGFDRNAGLPESQRIPRGRLLSRREARALVPGLPEGGLTGAVVWYDAQAESTERLVVAMLRAAAEQGACVANYAEVTGLRLSKGRITGARVLDRETGDTLEVAARFVINAAGPWTDAILATAGLRRPPVPLLRAVNLVLGRPVIARHGIGARVGTRFLFLVPWRDRALVGTDYEPAEGASVQAMAWRFLEDARTAFPWAGLEPEDVSLVHVGLVPGAGGADGLWSHSLVVDHEAEDGLPGLVTILGAKYTTARAVAERAVDRVVAASTTRCAPCRTAETPLEWARPLDGPLEEQARQATEDEMARSLADSVLRRLDLGTGGPPAAEAIAATARGMAAALDWTPERIERERAALDAALGALRLHQAATIRHAPPGGSALP